MKRKDVSANLQFTLSITIYTYFNIAASSFNCTLVIVNNLCELVVMSILIVRKMKKQETFEKSTSKDSGEMAGIVERNIQQLIKLRQQEEKKKTSDQHIADKITMFAGSMAFVYIHLVLFGIWILWNTGSIHLTPVDPSFTGLMLLASVEAIFLSTFVLIRQNRMNLLAEKRANLDLHVSLLAEHEITRLMTVVTAIAEKLDIKEAEDPEFDELKQDVRPEEVLETIDKRKSESVKQGGIDY